MPMLAVTLYNEHNYSLCVYTKVPVRSIGHASQAMQSVEEDVNENPQHLRNGRWIAKAFSF